MSETSTVINKNFEIVDAPIRQNKNGLFFREGTSDQKTLNESFKDYITVVFPGKIIMDAGANIGGFTHRAIIGGAKKVVAYEPEQHNFKMLFRNCGDLEGVELIEKALIKSHEKKIKLHLTPTETSSCSFSIKRLKDSRSFETGAINFREELERIKPDFIKMDIENGEYELLLGEPRLPVYVKEIILELHGMNKESKGAMDNLYYQLLEEFPIILLDEYKKVYGKKCLRLVHFSR